MRQGTEAAGADSVAGSRQVVLFDFDGVLVRHQTLELFLRQRLSGWGRWRLLPVLWLLPWVPLLKPTARGSRWLGRVFLRVATWGRTEASYRRLLSAFGREYARRPGVFVRDGVAALRRHVHAGDRVIVVSGNDRTLVEAILDEVSLTGYELVASQTRGGPFGVHFVRHVVDAGKVSALRSAGVDPPWAIAYGDSMSDLAMLRAVEAPMLVNPLPRTRKKITKLLGQRLQVLGWY